MYSFLTMLKMELLLYVKLHVVLFTKLHLLLLTGRESTKNIYVVLEPSSVIGCVVAKLM